MQFILKPRFLVNLTLKALDFEKRPMLHCPTLFLFPSFYYSAGHLQLRLQVLAVSAMTPFCTHLSTGQLKLTSLSA
jgi:hypothetical protein